ncbi:MAG: hypothetical protein ACRDOE_00235 [Streptosporangiaceae bacterium]
MAGIGDLLGEGSTAYQLFVWNVIGSFVSALMGPYTMEAQKLSNALHQAALLAPADLADMVNRGIIGEGDGAEQARLSGLPGAAFAEMVRSAGESPGPGQLAEMLRRHIIAEGSASDDGPSYRGGIAKSRLYTYWGDALAALALSLPSPAAAVEAQIRNVGSGGDPQTLYELAGGDPAYFQLMVDVTGQGPSPVEAGTLANRGFIPWSGSGADAVSFEQALRESHFKDKWISAYKELAVYRPPPRTVTAMYREGSVTREQAITMLQAYGVTPDAIASYLTPKAPSQTAKAKELTESQIVTAYKERAASAGTASGLLTEMGYSGQDAAFILATADAELRLQFEAEEIGIIHTLYTSARIPRNEASADLDLIGTIASKRDQLLGLWDLQIKQKVKVLSEADIEKAVKYKIISEADGEKRLTQLGYSADDAHIVILTYFKGQIPA